MTLTANRDVDHYVDQELRSYAVAASVHIFEGALVGLDKEGYVRSLVEGDPFVGIAYEEAEGDCAIRLFTVGDFGFEVVGARQVNIGWPVWAKDDAVLQMVYPEVSATTLGGCVLSSPVGIIQAVTADDQAIVRIKSLGSSHWIKSLIENVTTTE